MTRTLHAVATILAALLLTAPVHADGNKKKKKQPPRPHDPQVHVYNTLHGVYYKAKAKKDHATVFACARDIMKLAPRTPWSHQLVRDAVRWLEWKNQRARAVALIRLGQQIYPTLWLGSAQAAAHAAELAGIRYAMLGWGIELTEVRDGVYTVNDGYGMHDAVVQLYRLPTRGDEHWLTAPARRRGSYQPHGTRHGAIGAGWKRIAWEYFRAPKDQRALKALKPLSLGKWITEPGRYALLENVDGWRRLREFRVHSYGLFGRRLGRSLVAYAHDDRGAPLAGVRVRSVDDKGARRTHRTGPDGRVVFDTDARRIAVVADRDGEYQRVELRSRWRAESPRRVHIATDRPVYRPGQQVHFRALVRDVRDGRLAPAKAGQQVTWSFRDPRGRTVQRGSSTLDADGTIAGTLRLAPEPPLGEWHVVVHLSGGMSAATSFDPPQGFEGEEEDFWRQTFEVLSYRKPQMTVEVEWLEATPIEGGMRLRARVSAEYLFGGPVSFGRLEWVAKAVGEWTWDEHDRGGEGMRPPMRDPLAWHYQGRPDLFGRSETWSEDDELESGDGQLDAMGRAEVSFEVHTEDDVFASYHDRYELRATVIDSTRLSADGVGSRPGLTSGAIQPDRLTVYPERQYVAPGEALEVGVRLRSAEGVARAGEAVRLVAVTRRIVAGKHGRDDTVEWDPIALASAKTDANGEARARMILPESARGWVTLVARSKQGRDRWRLRVVDRRPLAEPETRPPSQIDEDIEPEGWLSSERPCYRVGETAKLLFHTGDHPRARHALLTIEGERIHESRVVALSTRDHLLELPLKAEYGPNVFVTMHVLDHRWPVGGRCELFVADPSSRLQVQVRPGAPVKGTRQEQTLTVITTIDGEPAPARVALGVVDEAIYRIARDDTPAIAWRMHPLHQDDGREDSTLHSEEGEGRSYRSWARSEAGMDDARGGAVGASFAGGAIFDSGDDAGDIPDARTPVADEPDVRRHFPDTLLWNGSVRTGADGTARVTLKTPDSLTRWRVTAYAQTAMAFGQGRCEFQTTAPVICRLAAPRAFVTGDRATLAVVVHNRTKQAGAFEVALKVGGAKLDGPVTRRVSVPAGADRRVDFDVRVHGLAPVTLEASAKSAVGSDAMSATVPVKAFGVTDFQSAAAGVVDPVWKQTLALPDSYQKGTATLDIAVGGSTIDAIRQALPFLVRYPHGCVEQTMSRFLPAVVARQAIRDLGLKVDLAIPLDEAINRGLQRLYGFQHADGGWGWWKHDRTDIRMTSYVVYGLCLAREAGVIVSPKVLELARESLHEEHAFALLAWSKLGDRPLEKGEERDQDETIAYLLKEAAADLQAVSEADEQMDEALAAAMLVLAGRTELVDKLRLELPKRARWDDVRHVGWTLRALASVKPRHPAVAKLRRWLLDCRRGPRWQTTLDTAHAVLALTSLLTAAPEKPVKVEVTVNGTKVALERGVARVSGLMLVSGDNEVVVRKIAGGTVRASASMSYVSRPGKEGRASGYKVTRRFERLDRSKPLPEDYWNAGGDEDPRWTPVAGKPLRVGDTLRVVVEVDVPRGHQEYSLIEIPIPAGTEAVLREPAKNEWWRDSWYQHVEARDDRIVIAARYVEGQRLFTYQLRATTPGRFRVLPAEAWNMYDTAQRGHSPATEVRVVDPEANRNK